MHWPLYVDILPRLRGTKIRGCHFCLPSALTLPCNHSMWSVLSGFSLRSETKVPGPEAFTAVTIHQMSALACPLSLPPPKKNPKIPKLATFSMSPFKAQYKLLREIVCVHVYLHVHKTQPLPQCVAFLLSQKGRKGDEETVPTCTQHSHHMPSDASDPISAHMTQCPMSPPQITSSTITIPHFKGSKTPRQRCYRSGTSH